MGVHCLFSIEYVKIISNVVDGITVMEAKV